MKNKKAGKNVDRFASLIAFPSLCADVFSRVDTVFPNGTPAKDAPSLAGADDACFFAVALVAMFFSSNEPAGRLNGVSTLNRIIWRNSHASRFADKAMLLNQLVAGDESEDSNQYKTYQKRSRSRHTGCRTVQVVAEEIAESAINACVETSANRIKSEEAGAAGARRSCEGRPHRVQPGDKLGHQQEG
jgi:hypothetical protein